MQFYSAKLYSSFTSALHANSGPIEVWEKNLLFLCKDLDTASKMVQKRGSSESFSLDEISWLPDESPMMSQYEGFRELCCISSVSVNEQSKASLPAGCIVSTSIFEFENTSSTGIEFEQQFQSSNFKYYGESSRQKLTILDPPFLDDLSLAMQQHLNMNLEVKVEDRYSVARTSPRPISSFITEMRRLSGPKRLSMKFSTAGSITHGISHSS
ncbi:MAG: hypothetical protein IPP57_13035 [Candidatus Obscuribacter sp.]|nr:hypothetical protein [Candidatus Obscuribacter sp.]